MSIFKRTFASVLCVVMMLSLLSTSMYDVSAASVLITPETTVTKDTNHTLTAHWEPKSYTLKFDGYPEYQRSITFDSVYGTLPVPTKAGYKFKGWFLGEGGAGTQLLSTDIVSVDDNQTVYANWVKTHSITYDLSGGTGTISDNGEYEAGDIVTISVATPTRVGYDFIGWKAMKTNDTSTVYFASQNSGTIFNMPDYELTLMALWVANVHYRLSYDLQSGTGAFEDVTNYEHGQYATVLTGVPIKYGYTFKEWATNANGSGAVYSGDSAVLMTANVTLYAQWMPKKVLIDMGDYGTKEVDFNDELGTLPNPSKPGYDFEGWYTDEGGNGEQLLEDTIVDDEGPLTLFPKWTPNVYYKLTYELKGGAGAFDDDYQYTYGQNATVSSVIPTKYGYLFKEWNRSENGTGTAAAGGSAISMTDNISIWAQWLPKKVTINFGDGTTKDVNFGDEIGSLPNPEKPGFDFDGWYDEVGGAGNKVIETDLISDEGPINLYPKWTPNTYFTLTYDLKGGEGSILDSEQYTHSQTASVTTSIPVRYGYTFKEWNMAGNGSGVAVSGGSNITMTSDVTLYAQWTPKKVTVNFNSDGSKEIDFGEEIGLLPQPNKPGYDFSGWWTEENGNGYQVFEDTVIDNEGPVTLYHKWVPNTYYTLTYNLKGGAGSLADHTQYTHGQNADVLTEIPTKYGHMFKNWSLNEDGVGSAILGGTSIEMTSSVTLYAQWTPKKVTIDFDGVTTSEVDFGNEIGILPTPPGNRFDGWYTFPNGEGDRIKPDTIVDTEGPLVLYPNFLTVVPVLDKKANVTEVNPGENIVYTITVGNTGTGIWNDVVAIDILPPNVDYVSFDSSDGATVTKTAGALTIDFGDLPSDSSKSVQITVKVKGEALVGETITNTVSVTDPNGGADITAVDPNVPEITPTPIPTPYITKTSNVDGVAAGEDIVYTIVAGNTGTAIWKEVVATDELPPEVEYITYTTTDGVTVSNTNNVLTLNFGDIAPGINKEVKITVRVKNETIPGTAISNRVSCGEIVTFDASAPMVTSIIPSVSKTSNVEVVNPGEDIIYTITAGNSGTAVWNNVIGIDILPSDVQYKSFSSADGVTVSDSQGTLTIDFGNIPPGKSKEVQITVRVKDSALIGETITNSISLPDPNGGHDITSTDPSAPQVTPSPAAEPTLQKSSNVSEIVPGEQIVYTITAGNTGTAVWQGVTATDILPAEVSFVTFSTEDGVAVSHAAGVLTIEFGDIAAGTSKTVLITVEVKDTVNAETRIVNSVSCGGITATDPVKPVVTRVIPSLVKTSNVTTVNPGGDIVYTITAGNSGTATWNNVIAVDILPASMDYKSYSSIDGVTVSESLGTLNIDFGDIPAGKSKTVHINVRVKATAAIGVSISNSISVPDPNSGQTITVIDPAAPQVTPTPVPVPVLEKSSNVTEIIPGGNIVYTIAASNTGTETWYSAEVIDVLPDEVVFVSFAATGGITVMNNDGTLTIGFGNIAPGASKTVYITVKVKETVSSDVTITNSISGGGATATDPIKPVVKKVIPSLVKTSNVTTVHPGSEIVYTIEAGNSGGAVWSNVIARDTLPTNVEYVSFNTTDGVTVVNTGGVLELNFGDIAEYSSKRVHITVRVKNDAEIGKAITNSVSAINPNGGPDILTADPDAPSITATPTPVPTLEKTSDVNEIRAGGNIVYTIKASNTGTETWYAAEVTDVLPSEVDFVSFAATGGITVVNNEGTLTIGLGDITPGASKTVYITVKVKDSVTPGVTITNSISGGGVTKTDPSSPIVATISPTLTKSSDTTEVIPGDNVVYTITAGNSGNASWDNVIATDILSASVEYVSAVSDDGVIVTASNNVLTLNFGNIAPSISKSVLLTVRVKENAVVGAPLVNSVICGGLTAVDIDPPDIISKEPEYQIIYDLAGGSGTFEDTTTYKSGETVTIASFIPERANFIFSGWKDGTGVLWAADDIITINDSNIYLTAQWNPIPNANILTVIYMTDDNEEPLSTETIEHYYDGSLTEAYVTSLLGDNWINKYHPDTTYENGTASFQDKNTVNVLYKKLFTLTYIFVGNSSVSHHTLNEAVTVAAPRYEKSGHYFSVWNTKSDSTGTSYKMGDIIYMTSDLDLYAQWTPSSSDNGTSGGDGNGASLTEPEKPKDESEPEILTDSNEYARSGPDESLKSAINQHLSTNTPFEDDLLLKAVRDYDRDEGIRLKYINGYPDVTVRPEQNITRAEAAQIFYNLLTDYDDGHIRNSTFKDVNSSDWFFQAVTFLSDLGVLNGYADGTLRPNDYITRAELTTITARLDVVGIAEQIPFKDMDFTHWASNYVVSAFEKGWVTGYNDFFRPDDNIKRSETVTIINKVLERFVQHSHVIPEANGFSDLKFEYWGFPQVMEAAVSKIYDTSTGQWLRIIVPTGK